jgi:hypothetical protein
MSLRLLPDQIGHGKVGNLCPPRTPRSDEIYWQWLCQAPAVEIASIAAKAAAKLSTGAMHFLGLPQKDAYSDRNLGNCKYLRDDLLRIES